MPVVPIACLRDNYAYAVFTAETGHAVVIDPSESEPVVECLEGLALRLSGLLLTHHHWDHVGGIRGLRHRYGDIPIVAHAEDATRVEAVNRIVADGETLELAGLSFRALHVPGHTLGAIAYLWQNAVFTGDTLFVAGCGRLFEGSARQMYMSLNRLASLPERTEMYCGHEYALQNLAFAKAIEPGNLETKERIARVEGLRAAGRPSVPATIGEERATNPFLRCDDAEFRARFGCDASLDGAALFAEIRHRRNEFRS